jgi:hypothetical protein
MNIINGLKELTTPYSSNGDQFDADEILLLNVDFKWLMAGLGWWIDTTRLHTDMTYAKGCLDTAMHSDSVALRNCATRLHIRNHVDI